MVAVLVVAAILLPLLLRSGPAAVDTPPPEEDGTLAAEETDALADLGEPLAVTATDPYEIFEHRVAEGETLAEIADQLGVTVEQIRLSNRLAPDQSPRPGETLRVPANGFLHLIQSGETLSDLANAYGVPVQELVEVNAVIDPARIIAGDWLIVPASPDEVAVNVSLALTSNVEFAWPLRGEVLSTFGYRDHPVLGTYHHHNGIDIDVPEGTPVAASAAGRVVQVGDEEGMGRVIYMLHAGDFYTVYGHLSETLVAAGDAVAAGERIALSGNTGLSTGPHLHFEIRHGAEFPVDPLKYLP